MTVLDLANERGVSEIVHFTTNKGLLGVLYTGLLKSRARLADDERLEHILKLNSATRKDTEWLDYVNLSVSQINTWFFSCSGRWHAGDDIWWPVLAFSPEILDHEGVVFATTNNIYTDVQRQVGEGGFHALFAPTITRWFGNVVARPVSHPSYLTTCEQAEVLYPAEVSTEWLRRIYVPSEAHADEVHAQIGAVRHRPVEVVVDASKFI
ncbi:MAG: DUF4433 domain-containing protein [Azonexus sp.]|nr:DarT ssDNA thymidine ADP-ribosyltransferase family protein [Azonexus sp.]MCK6411649.1 DUF4433 domain-containing protein [Azonexus sp.]